MQLKKKLSAIPDWFYKSPRLLCILGFVCFYLFSVTAWVPQASAAEPGGQLSNSVVRQVNIAQPAVVRIITKIGARLSVQFSSTSGAVAFPLSGGSYTLTLSGSGAFVSAHGDILTADHVVNPPHDASMDDALYQTAAQDVADYVNAHYQVTNGPFTANDAYADLSLKYLPSTSSYDQPTSKIYLNTAYTGQLSAAKLANLPTGDSASVDRIEAQSSFDANDVAIVHVSGLDNMPSIQLDDSTQVAVQDNLTIIGFPGLADVSEAPTNLLTASVNKVYVSALKTGDNGSPLLQVGGNIEHGDSGGPALDDAGRIVGIVSFSLVGSNSDTGETSFLQTSKSALALIQQANVDTTPGAFTQAWTQAVNDYASANAGHWHKAAQELQSLSNTYTNFQGANSYLLYAQSQATHEQVPGSSSSLNPGLIIGLVLVVIILAVLLVLWTRRNRATPAVATGTQFQPVPFGSYGLPQSNQSNVYPPAQAVYPPTPASYDPSAAGAYPPVPASYNAPVSGVYPPTPVSYGAPVSENYQPAPANYAPPAWFGQSDAPAEVAQTPLPIIAETPQPIVPEIQQVPFPVQSEQSAPFAAPGIDSAAGEVVLPRPHEYYEIVSQETVQPKPHEYLQADSTEATGPTESSQDAGFVDEDATLIEPLPSSDAWPTIIATPEPEVKVDDDRTVLFSPAEPSPVQKESIASGAYTWIAPCGHANSPDVRFCRICGQSVLSDAKPESSETL